MQFYKNDPILILRADLVNMPIGARLFLLVWAVASLHNAEEEVEELGASAGDEETGEGFLYSQHWRFSSKN